MGDEIEIIEWAKDGEIDFSALRAPKNPPPNWEEEGRKVAEECERVRDEQRKMHVLSPAMRNAVIDI